MSERISETNKVFLKQLEALPTDSQSIGAAPLAILANAGVRSFSAAEAVLADHLALYQSLEIPEADIDPERDVRNALILIRQKVGEAQTAIAPEERGDGAGKADGNSSYIAQESNESLVAHDLKGLPSVELFTEEQLVNWRDRDQGRRNTCVGFAVASCLDGISIIKGDGLAPYSPQFIYWNIREKEAGPTADQPRGWDKGATKLSQAQKVLENSGCALESESPYPRIVPDDERPSGPKPNDAAIAAALARKEDIPKAIAVDRKGQLIENKKGGAYKIYKALAESKRPVAIAVPTFVADGFDRKTNWNFGSGYTTGVIPMPPFGTQKRIDDGDLEGIGIRGHAVCVIGFLSDEEEEKGGWFLFKNSWGSHFGARYFNGSVIQSPDDGYGCIPAAYVERYCWEWLHFNNEAGVTG